MNFNSKEKRTKRRSLLGFSPLGFRPMLINANSKFQGMESTFPSRGKPALKSSATAAAASS
jgi:hypothetical protein